MLYLMNTRKDSLEHHNVGVSHQPFLRKGFSTQGNLEQNRSGLQLSEGVLFGMSINELIILHYINTLWFTSYCRLLTFGSGCHYFEDTSKFC